MRTDFFEERKSQERIHLWFVTGGIAVAAFEITAFGDVKIRDQRAEMTDIEPDKNEIDQIIEEELCVGLVFMGHFLISHLLSIKILDKNLNE
jgi:hypothetical protein